jgi:hypothetical protein
MLFCNVSYGTEWKQQCLAAKNSLFNSMKYSVQAPGVTVSRAGSLNCRASFIVWTFPCRSVQTGSGVQLVLLSSEVRRPEHEANHSPASSAWSYAPLRGVVLRVLATSIYLFVWLIYRRWQVAQTISRRRKVRQEGIIKNLLSVKYILTLMIHLHWVNFLRNMRKIDNDTKYSFKNCNCLRINCLYFPPLH